VPREDKLMIGDLFKLLEGNYELRRNRSINSMRYSFKHLREYFGDSAKVKAGRTARRLRRGTAR
jgi:hypothetical protein